MRTFVCCYALCSTGLLIWLAIHLLFPQASLRIKVENVREFQKHVRKLDYKNGQFDVRIPGAHPDLIWPQPVEHLSSQLAIAKIKGIHFEPFRILLEPRVCTAKLNLSLAIFVTTTPRAADNVTRNLIRNTWAKQAMAAYRIPVIFVVGRNINESMNPSADIARMLNESREFGDILMANIDDNWEHLIHKWWFTLHYHHHHCPTIEQALLADSDTVIFPEALMTNHRDLMTQSSDQLRCFIMYGQPVERGKESRYYVAEHQWPDEQLPQYCSGVLFMFSSEVAGRLSHGVIELGLDYVLSFKIFDVLTGAIAKAAGVKLQQIDGLRPWLPIKDICDPQMFALHGIKPADLVPKMLTYKAQCCLKWESESALLTRKCPFNGTIPLDEYTLHVPMQ